MNRRFGTPAKPPQRRPAKLDLRLRLGILAGVVIVVVAGLAVAAIAFAAAFTSVGSGGLPPGTQVFAENDHTHVTGLVTYDRVPPAGGPHNPVQLNCGVYTQALPNENAVHSLEHGAVWITYNPDKLSTDQVQTLASKVEGQPYMFMSPYPGMDSNFSLQSWGHQLKLTDVNDHRAANFISALRQNSNTYPEVGASCDAGTPTLFDPANPPAFDPTPPGAGAIPMDGKGLTPQLTNGQEQPPTGGAAATSAPAAVPPMTTTGGN
jgi:hypothetical protein